MNAAERWIDHRETGYHAPNEKNGSSKGRTTFYYRRNSLIFKGLVNCYIRPIAHKKTTLESVVYLDTR